MADEYNLERFVVAQTAHIANALSELRAGQKLTHWMWFIFPQLRGLGPSSTSDHFGITSLAEAKAYWAHATLGARLRDCTSVVLGIEGRSIGQIFGDPDNLKFHSSMTLFAEALPGEKAFSAALDKYFRGKRDPLTLSLLRIQRQ